MLRWKTRNKIKIINNWLQKSVWYGPINMDNRMEKKISDKVINFMKTMEDWKEERAARWKMLAEVEIQRDIFQRDSLLQLLFAALAMMPLSYELRKSLWGPTIAEVKIQSDSFLPLLFLLLKQWWQSIVYLERSLGTKPSRS